MQKYKISALPPNVSLDKRKEKTWTELLSPWIIAWGLIIFTMLCTALIGE